MNESSESANLYDIPRDIGPAPLFVDEATIAPLEIPGKFGKFEQLTMPGDGGTLMRAIRHENLSYCATALERADLLKRSDQLYYQLETTYHIPVVHRSYVWERKQPDAADPTKITIVTDWVAGEPLDEALDRPIDARLLQQSAKLFERLVSYYIKTFQQGGDYLGDIISRNQYLYGKRDGDELPTIYLADVGPAVDSWERQTTSPQAAAGLGYAFVRLLGLADRLREQQRTIVDESAFQAGQRALTDFLLKLSTNHPMYRTVGIDVERLKKRAERFDGRS